jgi:hypothetical protein
MKALLATALSSLVLVVGFAGCGGSKPAVEAPASSSTAEGASAEPGSSASAATTAAAGASSGRAASKAIPTACASNEDGYCLPDARFAKKVCEAQYSTVALVMFSKNAPWTHGYLTQKTKAWSASGAGSTNEELPAGEEVVVLLRRGGGDTGGMQVSGAGGSFEVLRWDGNCVTLQAGEMTTTAPANPKAPRILWNSIEMDMRDALLADPKLNEIHARYRKECRGVTMGDVSKKCEVADRDLNAAIVRVVREGGQLAEPTKRP